jgi:hypothetical protein
MPKRKLSRKSCEGLHKRVQGHASAHISYQHPVMKELSSAYPVMQYISQLHPVMQDISQLHTVMQDISQLHTVMQDISQLHTVMQDTTTYTLSCGHAGACSNIWSCRIPLHFTQQHLLTTAFDLLTTAFDDAGSLVATVSRIEVHNSSTSWRFANLQQHSLSQDPHFTSPSDLAGYEQHSTAFNSIHNISESA